jgi:hypothetical protein
MVRHWQIAGMNLFHFVWMVFMRFAGRRRHPEPTLAEIMDGGRSADTGREAPAAREPGPSLYKPP